MQDSIIFFKNLAMRKQASASGGVTSGEIARSIAGTWYQIPGNRYVAKPVWEPCDERQNPYNYPAS